MRYSVIVFAATLAAISARLPADADSGGSTAHCVLSSSSGSVFSGTCPLLDEAPRFTLTVRAAPEGGPWRPEAAPRRIWGGQMADQDSSTWPAQLQIFDAGSGVLQTVYGWFPITNYTSTPQALAFDVDRQNEVPPNALDVRIIERASQILSNPHLWNRRDNRKCSPSATTFSIYCAGEKAVEDVTGATDLLDHRRPAMEVIRAVVDDRSEGRGYHHRLMDYNNDPTTTFNDVQSLFRVALQRISDTAWLQRHGFAALP